MLLGTIMSRLRDEDIAAAALMSLGELVLVAEVESARVAHEESAGEYVSGAVQRFARLASDEDWLGMMTALERSDDPATTCLATMLRWSIARDAQAPGARETPGGCSCGDGGGSCHDRP